MTDEIIENTSANECFVCYEEEHPERPIHLENFHISRLCNCNAYIHPTCYATWLQRNRACPICRMPIRLDPNIFIENIENFAENIDNFHVSYLLRFRDPPRWVIILIYSLLFCIFLFTILLIFYAF